MGRTPCDYSFRAKLHKGAPLPLSGKPRSGRGERVSPGHGSEASAKCLWPPWLWLLGFGLLTKQMGNKRPSDWLLGPPTSQVLPLLPEAWEARLQGLRRASPPGSPHTHPSLPTWQINPALPQAAITACSSHDHVPQTGRGPLSCKWAVQTPPMHSPRTHV